MGRVLQSSMRQRAARRGSRPRRCVPPCSIPTTASTSAGSIDRSPDSASTRRRQCTSTWSRTSSAMCGAEPHPRCSTDLGAFNSLLAAFGPLGRIAASGRLSERSRVDDLGRWWFSFFMYFASGPPPAAVCVNSSRSPMSDSCSFLGAGTHGRVRTRTSAPSSPRARVTRTACRRSSTHRFPHRHAVGEPHGERTAQAAPPARQRDGGGDVRRQRLATRTPAR